MRSYRLYAAIVAIACIALQEVNCGRNQLYEDEYYGDSDEENDATSIAAAGGAGAKIYTEKDCGEFRAPIWNEAFSNPQTMQLATVVLNTVGDMAVEPVCSDTIRSLLNYVQVMATDENAHYAWGLFLKMLKTMEKQAVQDQPDPLGDTKKLVVRIAKSPVLRNVVLDSIDSTVYLLLDRTTRNRLLKLATTFVSSLKQSDNEKAVKETAQKVMRGVAAPAKGVMKKFGFLK